MPRRTTAVLEQDALAALSEALGRIGVVTNLLSREPSASEMRVDAVVEAAGQRFDVEVKSVVTAAHGELLARSATRDSPLIVVADRIAADAKRSLRDAGINYFDRRGELRMVSPPLFVDTLVESALPMAGGRGGSLDSQVAQEVAIACLLTPTSPMAYVRSPATSIELPVLFQVPWPGCVTMAFSPPRVKRWSRISSTRS